MTVLASCRTWWAAAVLGCLIVVPPVARAERTARQDVPCEAGPELRLTVDGNVAACRLATAAQLLVDPGGGNAGVACTAGSAVEFHPSGYLSFCDAAAAAAAFRGRAGRETRCRARARLAFSADGYLEYCS